MSGFGSALLICLVVVCWLWFLNYFPLSPNKISWFFAFFFLPVIFLFSSILLDALLFILFHLYVGCE